MTISSYLQNAYLNATYEDMKDKLNAGMAVPCVLTQNSLNIIARKYVTAGPTSLIKAALDKVFNSVLWSIPS